MRLIKIFLYILPSVLLTNVLFCGSRKSNVLVCYGKLKPETIKGYSYVILEPKHYKAAEIKVIKKQNEKVFAYMSVGEVNAHASHYPLLKSYTIGKNQTWNSYYLDLTKPTTGAVITSLIGNIFSKGYDGIFLDNLDNFASFGPQKSQRSNLVALLKSIHEKYPGKLLLQNAGLELVNDTRSFVDAIAIESVMSDYDFKNKKYRLRDSEETKSMMSKIREAKQDSKLPIILIEYAETKKLRDDIMKRIDTTGFDYFIGNINLQGIPQFKD